MKERRSTETTKEQRPTYRPGSLIRKDWTESDWFRLWLELVRSNRKRA